MKTDFVLAAADCADFRNCLRIANLSKIARVLLCPPLRKLREVVGDRIPRGTGIHKRVKLRTNPRIIIERSHADRNLRPIWPVTAKQTRAAIHAKRFHGTFTFAINAD